MTEVAVLSVLLKLPTPIAPMLLRRLLNTMGRRWMADIYRHIQLPLQAGMVEEVVVTVVVLAVVVMVVVVVVLVVITSHVHK